jgi:hypothetical protein
MSLLSSVEPSKRRKLLLWSGSFALLLLVGLGVFAKNGWLPHTDSVTGKKTGWFGQALPKNASSSWNPLAAPLPTATPQLSKELIYAGGRLLAVEDANANAAPPADLAVWRPAVNNGTWYVLGGPGSQQTVTTWGTTSDIPVQGDYDGDGKTDFSVFRPSTGDWYVLNSTSGYSVVNWGVSSDKTAQADFDGDGKTDIAIWRPSDGNWNILKSSGGYSVVQWGVSTDIPVPADYDGDGKADLAVWRPSTHTFWIFRSSDNQIQQVTLGSSTDVPVPADYDGDGKADCALKSGNSWIILSSSTNTSSTTTWQNSGDVPVPNDYDGDGKVDIAVWRDSNGTWYIRNSHDLSTRTQQWGTSGDTPVPAYYRR